MKYKISLCVSAACFLTALLLSLSARQAGQEALAERIAPDILRFHILANSDSPEDQALKLEIRDLVISVLERGLGDGAGKEETKAWLLQNKETIESMAQDYLLGKGVRQPVRLTLARDYFPTKAYGSLVFPCGTYEAARITIGEGKGHNWWCVLYPPLCYADAMHAVVPEPSENALKETVGEADYEAMAPRRLKEEKPEIEVRFWIWDFLAGLTG